MVSVHSFRGPRVLFALAFLVLSGGLPLRIPAQETEAAKIRTVQDLVREIEKSQKAIRKLEARIEMVTLVPIPGNAKPNEMKVVQIIQVDKSGGGEGERTRMEARLETPMGPMRVETVRGPFGIRIHQASELTGENWFKIDAGLVAKLDRVANRFGSSGAMQQAGGGRPEAFLGAELVRGLSRTHKLRLAKPLVVNGVQCHHLVGVLDPDKKETKMGFVRRPEEVHLYFDAGKFVMRKMVQISKGKTLLTIDLKTLDLNPDFQAGTFDLQPPKGVKFQDIMDDPIASSSVREALKRYRELEKEKVRKGEAEEKEASGKPSSQPKK